MLNSKALHTLIIIVFVNTDIQFWSLEMEYHVTLVANFRFCFVVLYANFEMNFSLTHIHDHKILQLSLRQLRLTNVLT